MMCYINNLSFIKKIKKMLDDNSYYIKIVKSNAEIELSDVEYVIGCLKYIHYLKKTHPVSNILEYHLEIVNDEYVLENKLINFLNVTPLKKAFYLYNINPMIIKELYSTMYLFSAESYFNISRLTLLNLLYPVEMKWKFYCRINK